MADPVVGKPRRRRGKPSAQGNAQKSTQSNCVGMKTVFNPPVPLYTYDHFSGEITDLYAGDISVDYFIKNILTPVAEAAYINYKKPVISPMSGMIVNMPSMTKKEYIQEYNHKFINKKEVAHIKSWKNIVEWTSNASFFGFGSDNLEPVVLGFVDKATAESVRSPADMTDIKNRKIHSDSQVNKLVALHDHLAGNKSRERNLSNIQKRLVNDIRSHGVNVHGYVTTQNDDSSKRSIVALVQLNDYSSGLGILCNGTLGYKVEILSYTCLGSKKGEIRYRYTIYDHFGLDEQDLSLIDPRPHMKWYTNIIDSRQSFLSWFYLQRVIGYKPVITEIVNEYTVSTEYEGTKHVK